MTKKFMKMSLNYWSYPKLLVRFGHTFLLHGLSMAFVRRQQLGGLHKPLKGAMNYNLVYLY
jgi:hypothetical protein